MKFQAAPIITNAQYLLNDSRQLSSPSTSIFFAIKGLHHDGHQFLNDLYHKGVRKLFLKTFDKHAKFFPQTSRRSRLAVRTG